MNEGQTHWEGCWREHHECAVAEIERIRAQACDATEYVLAQLVDELRNENASLWKDAERYRWLFPDDQSKAQRFNDVWRWWDGQEHWDDAVDRAMNQ